MSWADRIARITESDRFMTAQVRVAFESNPGEYDAEEDETTGQVIDTLYEGRARVVAVRTSIYKEPAASMNSRVSEFVRVQVPKGSIPDRVLTGAVVWIDSAPDSPFLEGRMVTVQSDFHGATSASRTLECAYDGDSVANG